MWVSVRPIAVVLFVNFTIHIKVCLITEQNLWGHLKAIVYGVKIQDVQHLKLRILDACAGISPAVLLSVCEEWENRVALTIQHNGQHIEHIL